MTLEMTGEVVTLGKSYSGEKGDQRIEISFKDSFGIRSACLYLNFKGESQYVLGQYVTITLEPASEHHNQTQQTQENDNANR